MRIGEISDGTKSRLLKRGYLSAHERHHWTVVSKKRLSDYIKPGYLMGKIRRLGARVHSAMLHPECITDMETRDLDTSVAIEFASVSHRARR